ncbi:hypothetical protein BT96DRAFT_84758 [Gymnopus androsaceus JB14]|uniref:Uncharacterized protein n=1 Tax=Gymnopus androsaceus JB14 TaxID=1447944 RepID=A0A6A4IEU7_9AGAR|nr:hypothetical protein BT96DRAFT_84758 [Gymnopus androsaceus JB14]
MISQPETNTTVNRERQLRPAPLRASTSTEAFPSQPSNRKISTPVHSRRPNPYSRAAVHRQSQPSRSMQRAVPSVTGSSPPPYFPPRRPIQRSMFAEPDSKPSIVDASSRPRASISEISIIPSMTKSGEKPRMAMGDRPLQQPLSSPLKYIFDYTMVNLYSGLAQLNSAWGNALNKERNEKERMRAHYLKMQRERDIAVERLEKSRSASYSVVEIREKRSREDDDAEEAGIQLPMPPTSCSLSPSDSSSSHSPEQDDPAYSLVYPAESSLSPSPPPPPISGRRTFFPSSSPPLSSSSPRSGPHRIISLEDASLPPPPASAPAAMSFRSSERPRSASPSDSDRRSVRSSSSKRRRLSPLTEDALAAAAEEAVVCASVYIKVEDSEGEGGECDMDLGSDNESSNGEIKESVALNWSHPRVGALGKKLLFTDHDDDGDSTTIIQLVSLPKASDTTTTVSCSSDFETKSTPHPNPVSEEKPDTDISPAPSTLEIPRLNLHDLNYMYFKHNSCYYCRVCCLLTPGAHWRPLPPDLDILVNHCTSDHPETYSQVAGLTLQQVIQLQMLLKANGSSSKTPPATV